MKDLSIYIHVPFCVRKCLYCDFLSFPVDGLGNKYSREKAGAGRGTHRQGMESYVNLLEREIRQNAENYTEYRVISIFWGGGTPSILPAEDVSRIMEVVKENYQIAGDAEITIEMNPGTADACKLRQYITAGMNRISIGLQSADDKELARIGRIHDYGAFLETYELARNAGFCNINIDIMASLPGQGVSSYEKTLRNVAALEPEHISAYSLILEEGTPLYENQSDYQFPSEEEDREMYTLTKEYLASCGYHRYEISNYAKKGFECRHNKVYWQRGDYLGVGLGASSMVQNVRWKNPDDMMAYGAYVGRLAGEQEKFVLDRQILAVPEQMEEYMFLGLRMMCGVSRREFAGVFGCRIEEVYGEVIDRLCRQGLLSQGKERIRLTDRGIDVSNYAMSQFLFD